MTRGRPDTVARFIEEFGNLYASYGLKRLNGMIVGLLLCESGPISLDDISTKLGRSKGPISVAVRQLAAGGIVHRVAGPENRKDYYRADSDVFYSNHKLNMRTVRKNRMIAERYLGDLRTAHGGAHGGAHGAAHGAALPALEENLRRMHAFYTLMESYYSGFAAAWEQMKQNLAQEKPTE